MNVTLTDTIALSETSNGTVNHQIVNTFSVTDKLISVESTKVINRWYVAVSDSLALTDSWGTVIGAKHLADTLQVIDPIYKELTKQLNDSFSFDTSNHTNSERFLTDTLELGDNLVGDVQYEKALKLNGIQLAGEKQNAVQLTGEKYPSIQLIGQKE